MKPTGLIILLWGINQYHCFIPCLLVASFDFMFSLLWNNHKNEIICQLYKNKSSFLAQAYQTCPVYTAVMNAPACKPIRHYLRDRTTHKNIFLCYENLLRILKAYVLYFLQIQCSQIQKTLTDCSSNKIF